MSEQGPTFNDPALREPMMRLRQVDNVTNLAFLALEYLGLIAVIGGAIAFAEHRAAWGLAWSWNVPVFAVAVVLIGGFQHRLSGLGHEASHYTLLRNKFLNDLVGDVFCFFPVLGTVHFYRMFHMAHHQYTNDPERDPDLVTLGPGKQVDRFPMPRLRFLTSLYLRPLLDPASFARFQFDYIYINSLGKGNNIYMRRVPDGDAADPLPRLGTILGLAYLLGFIALQWVLTASGRPLWLIPAGVAAMALAAAGVAALPDRALFRSPFRHAYSVRAGALLRLGYFSAVLVVLGLLRAHTGGRSTIYFGLLWCVPIMTTFSMFLLIRDVYQHTNADRGRLTNTRVFFCDPFTRWAVFIYGQGMHLPHHLFPAIPHYRLGELHRLLKRSHAEYAARVVECHGTFLDRLGRPTIMDLLCTPRPDADPDAATPPEGRADAPPVHASPGFSLR